MGHQGGESGGQGREAAMQLQRAMAAEAEATRQAKAKEIRAQGELLASKALKEASDVISSSPAALQLR